MPTLKDATHEINCKVVYYGPGFCGKTTNLQYIHSQLAPEKRGEMVSMATQSDRTLFFDFLPLDLEMVHGWHIRLCLYTVPGQIEYNASRKVILNGVDAVVFVADSDPFRATDNIESFNNMVENLAQHKIKIQEIPLVLQYNKRDLVGAMPIERMESELNTLGLPSYESVASEGKGVFATLRGISKILLNNLSNLV